MNAHDLSHWDRCRPFIEAALSFTGGTHTIEDIKRAVDANEMQFWPGQQSAVITEIQSYPQAKGMHYFLAGGDLEELSRMRPILERWAQSIGCNRVTLAGRRGWLRTFLVDEGYEEKWTVMSKELNHE